MTADHVIVCAAALSLVAAAAGLALLAFYRTTELVTPWTIFLGMATLDIFLPAAVQTVAPMSILSPGTTQHFAAALGVFVVAAAVFALGYAAGQRIRVPRVEWLSADTPNLRRAELVLILAAVVCLWRISESMEGFSSVQDFIANTLRSRFASRPVPQGLVSRLLFQISGVAPMCAFMCIGVLFVNRRLAPFRFGVLWPAAGLLLAMTTFFRGTILMYMVGLLVLETFRRKEALAFTPRATLHVVRANRRLLAYGFGVVLMFVAYGSVRNWMTDRAWGVGDSYRSGLVTELQQLAVGHGLVGLASIIDQYPRRVPYFGGKTLTDMLLLPVPRTIWHSKPDWYGIDEITRAMGWPPTSQSAVTMPGELWANFGPLGVALMIGYGLFFGIAYGLRLGPRFRYLYAFNVLPLAFTSFWMAFSAVMNALILLPVLAAVVTFIIPPRPAAGSTTSLYGGK